jgi:hypothetical protein
LQHVNRMDRARNPKQIVLCVPIWRRLPGRPNRRGLERNRQLGLTLELKMMIFDTYVIFIYHLDTASSDEVMYVIVIV